MAFLDTPEHWNYVQMIQFITGNIFVNGGRLSARAPPQNCVVSTKVPPTHPIFETVLKWVCFRHCFKHFKVGVANPGGEIGSWTASLPFGTLIECVGGAVKWAGPAENQKWPKSASSTPLARIQRSKGGQPALAPWSKWYGGEWRKKEPSFGSGGKRAFELLAAQLRWSGCVKIHWNKIGA